MNKKKIATIALLTVFCGAAMKGLQIVRKSREDNNPEIVEVELEELDHEK